MWETPIEKLLFIAPLVVSFIFVFISGVFLAKGNRSKDKKLRFAGIRRAIYASTIGVIVDIALISLAFQYNMYANIRSVYSLFTSVLHIIAIVILILCIIAEVSALRKERKR